MISDIAPVAKTILSPMSTSKRLTTYAPNQASNSGILNERVLLLVFESLKWDLHTLCVTASLNRKLHAIAKRLLWRELCANRAPRMVSTLTNSQASAHFDDFWRALAKLMFFCCGCNPTRNFRVSRVLPGHFVKASRFSKTSGRSFLIKKCRGDLLYVSDPCEHTMADHEDDLGVYRGVFKGFTKSRTRAWLIRRQVNFEESISCPYCGARVWSMSRARLTPKSAARRLGSRDGRLEYFVCVNGHLHGACWLTPLSSDEDRNDDVDNEENDDGDEVSCDLGIVGEDEDCDDQTVASGSTSSTGEEIVSDPFLCG
ncbi:hypothetical protein K2173_004691 [Erythroxylum novogranatense]|uniref:EID1-like F-box protein 3 n=1 Tax=Erythroxylum novogranatense TaxID=1862640 RepID=A0AAV8UBN7_9ROSI|nr:hypothetical protein K2173_004691 [Erythroxylum novogranatense]